MRLLRVLLASALVGFAIAAPGYNKPVQVEDDGATDCHSLNDIEFENYFNGNLDALPLFDNCKSKDLEEFTSMFPMASKSSSLTLATNRIVQGDGETNIQTEQITVTETSFVTLTERTSSNIGMTTTSSLKGIFTSPGPVYVNPLIKKDIPSQTLYTSSVTSIPQTSDIDGTNNDLGVKTSNLKQTLFCFGSSLTQKGPAGTCSSRSIPFEWSGEDCQKKCKCNEKGEMQCTLSGGCNEEAEHSAVTYCKNGGTFTCVCLVPLKDDVHVDELEGGKGIVERKKKKPHSVSVVTKTSVSSLSTASHVSFPPISTS